MPSSISPTELLELGLFPHYFSSPPSKLSREMMPRLFNASLRPGAAPDLNRRGEAVLCTMVLWYVQCRQTDQLETYYSSNNLGNPSTLHLHERGKKSVPDLERP